MGHNTQSEKRPVICTIPGGFNLNCPIFYVETFDQERCRGCQANLRTTFTERTGTGLPPQSAEILLRESLNQ